MKRVIAIARLTLRHAVRSRVAIATLVLLLLTLMGLPLTLKGDGTVGGRVQIILSYTLGFAGFLLGLATLWIGCSTVALDVQERQIHLVVVKPVSRWQIWLGKWLGLLFLNALLLAFSGLVTYGLLLWNVRPAKLTPEDQATLAEELLVARRTVNAEPVDVSAEAQRRFDEQVSRGNLPPDAPLAEIRRAMELAVRAQAYAVGPDGRREWVFHLPQRPPPDRPLLVRFRYNSSALGGGLIRGLWLVGRPDTTDRIEIVTEHVPGGLHVFRVDPSVLDGGKALVVEFANINPVPLVVVFAPEDGVQVLAYAGGFVMNYVRALLIWFARLAFLAALGVTAGSLFSLPVAVFLSLYALVLLGAAPFVHELATRNVAAVTNLELAQRTPLARQALGLMYKALSVIVRPLNMPDVLLDAATGRLVSWSLAARVWLAQVVLYTGLLAALGMSVLTRRELGLPSTAP